MKLYSTIFFCLVLISLTAQDLSKQAYEKVVKDKVSEKIRLLENYIRTIGDKSLEPEQCKDAIKSACRLFAENSTIEVSNIKTGKKTKKTVYDYFDDLYRLNYAKVEISFFQNSVGIFKNENGKRFLNGIIRQKFQAKDNTGKIVYHDYTIKNIEVEVREVRNRYQKIVEIIFHNITVVNTTY